MSLRGAKRTWRRDNPAFEFTIKQKQVFYCNVTLYINFFNYIKCKNYINISKTLFFNDIIHNVVILRRVKNYVWYHRIRRKKFRT